MRPAMGMNNMPAPTEERTTGIPVVPVVTSSIKLSLAATQTIPVCRIVFVDVVMPGLKVPSSYPMVFLIDMPRRMATGIPEMGMAKVELSAEAIWNPPKAVAAERPMPGRTEAAAGFGCSFFLMSSFAESFFSFGTPDKYFE